MSRWCPHAERVNIQYKIRQIIFLLIVFLSLSLHFRSHPSIRERSEIKTERGAANQSSAPTGTGFFSPTYSCGLGGKQKLFHLLAVNMPTAAGTRTLETAWNDFLFGVDCEWSHAGTRRGACHCLCTCVGVVGFLLHCHSLPWQSHHLLALLKSSRHVAQIWGRHWMQSKETVDSDSYLSLFWMSLMVI